MEGEEIALRDSDKTGAEAGLTSFKLSNTRCTLGGDCAAFGYLLLYSLLLNIKVSLIRLDLLIAHKLGVYHS